MNLFIHTECTGTAYHITKVHQHYASISFIIFLFSILFCMPAGSFYTVIFFVTELLVVYSNEINLKVNHRSLLKAKFSLKYIYCNNFFL
jgi:hypothetical protein